MLQQRNVVLALFAFRADGFRLNAEYANLYSKENLWILFEYVIPKLGTQDMEITFGSPTLYHHWVLLTNHKNPPPVVADAVTLSEALCEAILKVMEVSSE